MGDMIPDDNKARTISKAIRFKFELFASNICDGAKVEFADRPYKIQEWMLRLEHRFREIDALGKTTDETTGKMVLEMFGPAQNTIKVLRGGWRGLWHRMLYYERYVFHRLLALALVCLLHDSIRISSSIHYSVVQDGAVGISFLVPNVHYYLGILFLAVVTIPRWIRPRGQTLKRIVKFAAVLVACWFYYSVFTECLKSIGLLFRDFNNGTWHRPDEGVPIWKDAAVGVFWMGALLFEFGALLAAVPLIISEIFALPRQRREKLEARRHEIGVR